MYLFELIPCVLRHPLDTFRLIKADRRRFSWLPALTLFFLFVAIRIVSLFLVHYPLAAADPMDANILLEIVFALAPPVSLGITVFGLTSILDGESMLRENITAAAFCLTPYVVFQIPLALLTRILGLGEAALFHGLTSLIWVWVAVLFLVSVTVMNGYRLGKALLVIMLSIVSVLLFWGTLFLLYALFNQFALFLSGVYREAKYVLFGM